MDMISELNPIHISDFRSHFSMEVTASLLESTLLTWLWAHLAQAKALEKDVYFL